MSEIDMSDIEYCSCDCACSVCTATPVEKIVEVTVEKVVEKVVEVPGGLDFSCDEANALLGQLQASLPLRPGVEAARQKLLAFLKK